MLADGFVAAEDAAWAKAGERVELGPYRVVPSGESLRVQLREKTIFERNDRHIPKFAPTCTLRLRQVGTAGIVVERRCVLSDEGVEITDLDAWFCDDSHCS